MACSVKAGAPGKENVRLLLEMGANPSQVLRGGGLVDGTTLLMYSAVYFTPDDSLQLLLEHGAEVGAINGVGNTVLHCAANDGDDWSLMAILATQPAQYILDINNKLGLSALEKAIMASSKGCADLFLDAGASYDRERLDQYMQIAPPPDDPGWKLLRAKLDALDAVKAAKALDQNTEPAAGSARTLRL